MRLRHNIVKFCAVDAALTWQWFSPKIMLSTQSMLLSAPRRKSRWRFEQLRNRCGPVAFVCHAHLSQYRAHVIAVGRHHGAHANHCDGRRAPSCHRGLPPDAGARLRGSRKSPNASSILNTPSCIAFSRPYKPRYTHLQQSLPGALHHL